MASNFVVAPLLERYQKLVDIGSRLTSTFDLDILLNQIVHAAADLCGAEAASILLYDSNSKQLRFQATTNLDEPEMRGLLVPVEASLSGWIVTNRQPIIISDALNDPRHFHTIGQVTQTQTHSLLGVPMITQDKVIGVLEAINKQEGSFDQEDQDLLSALCSMAAVSIENTRLFQQSDLVSELIHELRTPLGSINTAAHLLLRAEVPTDQRARMVQIIQDETFRLSDMTTSFLDLARLESGRAQFHPEVFPFAALVEECVTFMQGRAAERGIQICWNTPGDLPPLKADRNKIKQVVQNLLSNAIKYNRENGTITLTTSVQGEYLVLEVADTGHGMSPDALSHLFEKFFRAPGAEHLATGTGLGLSICKRIVEAHSGRIEAHSEIEVGTRFVVTLPVTQEVVKA